MAVTTQTTPAELEECDRGPDCRDCASEREAAETKKAERGYKPTPQAAALEAIFTRAAAHDTLCQLYDARLYEDIVYSKKDDANKNAYHGVLIEFCAAITSAALRRIPESAVTAQGIAYVLEGDLEGVDIEGFLRPLFEESGIGARFEPRYGYEVYPPAD